MAATSQITVNAAGFTAVTVQNTLGCKNVRIMENPGISGWPTSDFLIAKPLSTSTPVRIPAGSAYTFSAASQNAANPASSWLAPGSIVGYVKLVSGSSTFDQDEDQ
jgi:hypothetical protein